MKLEDISRFVFVNPSPNMFRLSKHVKSFGFDVEYVSVENDFDNQSEKIYYFYNEHNAHFDLTMLEKNDDDKRSLNFNKSFMKKLKFNGYKDDFNSYMSDFGNGNFVDLQLLKKQRIKDLLPIASKEVSSFTDLKLQYPDSVFIASWLPYTVCPESSCVEHVEGFETDMDLKHCFGNEYFILLTGKNRIEMFCLEGLIYIVSPKGISGLEILNNRFPFMKKFFFKLKSSKEIVRNRYPWVRMSKAKDFIVMNDYSFFNVSVKMSDKWYEAAGRFLCSGKLS